MYLHFFITLNTLPEKYFWGNMQTCLGSKFHGQVALGYLDTQWSLQELSPLEQVLGALKSNSLDTFHKAIFKF